jgi:hypothetical protein
MGFIFLIINTFSLTAINPKVFVMRHIFPGSRKMYFPILVKLKTLFNQEDALFLSKLDGNLKKKLIKWYNGKVALYNVEI